MDTPSLKSDADATCGEPFGLQLPADRPELALKAGDVLIVEGKPGWGADGLHVERLGEGCGYLVDRAITLTRRGKLRRKITFGNVVYPSTYTDEERPIYKVRAVQRDV